MGNDDLERYFDCAGSAPTFPEALRAQEEAALRWFANPSASHAPGRAAREELDRLRAAFGALCGFADGRLVLTSGATEANNLAIRSVLARAPRGRVLAAADAHASVLRCGERHRDRMDLLSVDRAGRIPVAAVAGALRPDTRLVCLSHAANETGAIHDVAAIAALCERRGVACLVDGAQALGHLPVDLSGIPCDFYTFSAHKFGGPRGAGGILWRSGEGERLLDGGPQEWGLRPGTENLPGLAGAVAALRRSTESLAVETGRLRALALLLVDEVRRTGIPFLVNGDPAAGLPGLVSLSFPGLHGHALVADLSLAGFAVATGSACRADRAEPSPAILALGRTADEAIGTVRISSGRNTTETAVRSLAAALAGAARRQAGRG